MDDNDVLDIGYLGPPGTYTEKAAKRILTEMGASQAIVYPSIEDVLSAASEGVIGLAVVPLENSSEGVVNVTLDIIIFDTNLFIQRQVVLPISHCLLSACKKSGIKRIYSHGQSLAQCRQYLKRHFSNIKLIPVSSNAEAARIVSMEDSSAAAIASETAAELYNLSILDSDIQDSENNSTIFVVIANNKPNPPLTEGKVAIAFSTENKPGSLNKILNIFHLWDINMTKIISRPMKNRPGEYVFYIELEDYKVYDLQDSLNMIKRKTNFYKYLGSYPKA
jgi:prephenate dehydratase